jgi:glucose/arabinose dehydrogenase
MRNAWGMTFHPETGELWVTDNGPNGHDEVNRILPGNDYGYPTIDGGRGRVPGLVDPLWESGNERLGITGATFYTGDRLAEFRGDLFFCDFVTGTLRRARLSPTQDTIAAVQKMGQNCRLDVAQGPDGALYLADIGAIHRWAR